MPAPAYPAGALADRISGKVVLVVDVDAKGKPVHVQVERSEPPGVFDQASTEAAMKWRFEPAVENGRPVASRLRVPVEFKAPSAGSPPAPAEASTAGDAATPAAASSTSGDE
ncbi:MAG: energy transducer TonB [Lysobacter sp.]|nr:energy transducer TonB [Lysobacter sp.]